MPEIQGKVTYLKVGNDFCFAKIEDVATGMSEVCPIWMGELDESEITPTDLAIRSMQFELLRTSLESGKTVVVDWNSSTGLPYNVKLLAQP